METATDCSQTATQKPEKPLFHSPWLGCGQGRASSEVHPVCPPTPTREMSAAAGRRLVRGNPGLACVCSFCGRIPEPAPADLLSSLHSVGNVQDVSFGPLPKHPFSFSLNAGCSKPHQKPFLGSRTEVGKLFLKWPESYLFWFCRPRAKSRLLCRYFYNHLKI